MTGNHAKTLDPQVWPLQVYSLYHLCRACAVDIPQQFATTRFTGPTGKEWCDGDVLAEADLLRIDASGPTNVIHHLIESGALAPQSQ